MKTKKNFSFDKKVLVTGGSGFIGINFLLYMVKKYDRWYFVNLDKLTYASKNNSLESLKNYANYLFVKGDIIDTSLLNNLFLEYDFNFVINFAAESHVDNSIIRPRDFINTNIIGTHELLLVSKINWLDKEQPERSRRLFLQISTDEVYGSLGLDGSFSEDDSIRPNSPYSASKASAEMLAHAYYKTYGLPIIVSRSCNNYGPYQNLEKLVPKAISHIISNQPVPVYGDGLNIREWIYVFDNVTALETLILNGNIGQFYNIGSGFELNNIEIISSIARILNIDNHNIVHVKDRLGHDFRYSLDTKKILELNWKPSYDFQSGLKITTEYYVNEKNSRY